MEQYKLVSLSLQQLAQTIQNNLEAISGERLGFILIVSVDNTAQYVSNLTREDGKDLLDSLLKRWVANRADIPAHYNPDLKR